MLIPPYKDYNNYVCPNIMIFLSLSLLSFKLWGPMMIGMQYDSSDSLWKERQNIFGLSLKKLIILAYVINSMAITA